MRKDRERKSILYFPTEKTLVEGRKKQNTSQKIKRSINKNICLHKEVTRKAVYKVAEIITLIITTLQ